MAIRSLSVRSKLALLFLSACALTFGVGGSFISKSASNALEGEILSGLEFQSRAYANALERELWMLVRRCEDFASDGFVRDAAEALIEAQLSIQGHEALRASLEAHLDRNKLPLVSAFTKLEVFSLAGEDLLESAPLSARMPLGWLALSTAPERVVVSNLMAPLNDEGVARLALAAPLGARESDRRLGWLVAWVNPSAWIFGALGPAGLGSKGTAEESGQMHLFDSQGSRLSLRREVFGAGMPTPDSEHARSGFGLALAAAGQGLPGAQDAPRGEGQLRRRFPMMGNTWQLEVESNSERELAAVAGLQGRVFGLGILVALAACLLFLLPMGILMRPLRQLAEAARRVGEGDLGPLAITDSNDEIGEVGRSFAAMAQAVKERTRLYERSAMDLRQRQGELQAERDRLQAVIGSMRGGLIVLAPDGRPVVFNQEAEPVLRALHEGGIEIDSHHICERKKNKQDACNACLFDPEQAPRSCQVEIGARTFEIHASQLPPDVDGRVGRVLVCHDFTDRVNQDERMIHQERLAVLGEVAAVMAHELNNPLAAISMYNQMLAAELGEGSALAENVDVIQRNVESCKSAIRELLDYATGATPEVDSIHIGAVLEDVAAFTRPLCERAGVELLIRTPETPPLAWGDELQVRQIFVNLLVNAIQAMQGRGGHVRMDVKTEGRHVVVLIADDGPGIALENQADIFRPFFTTKARGEGTGLGLPTARRIAEMHGGGLELVQTGELGSVFCVRLMQQEASFV